MKRFLLILILAMYWCPSIWAEIETGKCGVTNMDIVSYKFNTETGLLTVVGLGDMARPEILPDIWSDDSSVKTIVIERGVKSLGDNCFANCIELTSVTLPEGITSLGIKCFNGCNKLAGITLPESVTSLGERCFRYCSALRSIKIPDSVTNIGNECFAYCGELTEITLPKGITNLGYQSFCNCEKLNSLIVPEGITSIGNECFYGCKAMSNVTLPESVTSLQAKCFESCSALTTMICYAATPPTVGEMAFQNTLVNKGTLYVHQTSVDAYKKDANWAVWSNILPIEGNEDEIAAILTSEILTGDCSATDKDKVSYNFNKKTGHLVIEGKGAMKRPEFMPNANYEDNSVKTVEIKEGVTSLDEACFRKCKALTDITLPEGVTSLGESCFEGSALTKIALPKSVTNLGNFCFLLCDSLSQINIPDGITSLSRNCFNSCSALTEIILPRSVKEIGSGCFYKCTSLIYINLPEGITSLNDECFSGCSSLTGIVLPNSIKSLGSDCFSECSSLTEIYLPEGVTNLGKACFFKCKSLRSIDIPEGVTALSDYCFSWDESLTRINIPKSVTNLGSYCFFGCTSLTTMICQNTTPPTVGKKPFESVPANRGSLHVPQASIDSYRENAVWSIWNAVYPIEGNEDSLGIDTIPEIITGDCSATADDQVTYSFVKKTGHLVIEGKGAMKRLSILRKSPSVDYIKVKSIGSIDYLVKTIEIKEGVTSLGEGCFADCNSLTSIILPEGVTSLGNSCFQFCDSLTNITIPKSVTSLGDCCFGKCSSLSSINIPKDITSLGDYCFSDCKSLNSMACFAATPPTAGTKAFDFAPTDKCTLYVPQAAIDAYKKDEVWAKWSNILPIEGNEDKIEGIESTTMDNDIHVSSRNGEITLTGLTNGERVVVYSLNGKLIYSGSSRRIAVPSGIYIIQIAGKSYKMAVTK